jgi:HEAT repeat protein
MSTLAAVGEDNSVLWLTLRKLKKGDDDARRAAALHLGFSHDIRAVQPLVEAARTDTLWEVRYAAAMALGRLKDANAVPALLNVLQNIPTASSPYGIEEAITTLASLGGIEPLTQLLMGSGSLSCPTSGTNARQRARVHVLRELAKLKAVPALLAFLDGSERDEELLTTAMRGLFRDERACEPLFRIVTDGRNSFEARFWAAHQLAYVFNDVRSVPALLGLLQEAHGDERRIESIRRMLVDTGDRSAIEPLIEILANKESPCDVRAGAAQALVEFRDPSAAPTLIAVADEATTSGGAWDGRNMWVMIWALGSLHTFGSLSAVDPLTRLLGKEDSEIHDLALALLMKDPNLDVINALAETGSPKATIPALFHLSVNNRNADVRHAARAAMAQIDPEWIRSIHNGAKCFDELVHKLKQCKEKHFDLWCVPDLINDLTRFIECCRAEPTAAALQDVCTIEEFYILKVVYSSDGVEPVTFEKELVDPSCLRHLARQELMRRGPAGRQG